MPCWGRRARLEAGAGTAGSFGSPAHCCPARGEGRLLALGAECHLGGRAALPCGEAAVLCDHPETNVRLQMVFCVWPSTVWRGEWSTQPPEPVGCAAGAVPPGGSTGRRPGGSGSAGLCGQSALGGAHCANSAGTLRLIQLSKTRVSFLFNCFSS